MVNDSISLVESHPFSLSQLVKCIRISNDFD